MEMVYNSCQVFITVFAYCGDSPPLFVLVTIVSGTESDGKSNISVFS